MEGFSERLRHLIDKAGITPYEVSMKTGISQSTLSRLLNKATSKPNIKNVEILANYFCVNKVWLLTGEGEMLRNSDPAPGGESPMQRRIRDVMQDHGLTADDFAEKIRMKPATFAAEMAPGGTPSDVTLVGISRAFGISRAWIMSGEGEMTDARRGIDESVSLIDTSFDETPPKGRNLIPFFDSVQTMGGRLNGDADVDTYYGSTAEYIDAGDWFRGATSAIRHYEDSMDEYPSGCILILREIFDPAYIIPGRDYVVETDEYRVTKRLRRGRTPDVLMAESTNTEKYEDGSLVHPPFSIPVASIRHISLVLGYVAMTIGNTVVFSNRR